MKIINIEWLDKSRKEAIVTICDGKHIINCFADGLRYSLGDEVTNSLYALDIEDVKTADNKFSQVKMISDLSCQLIGKLCCNKSIIKVGNICIDIAGHYIPNDLKDDDIIEAKISRADLD